MTAAQLHREYFPQVSEDTVRRRLKDEGLKNYKQRTVPLLKAPQVDRRLEWGESVLLWTVQNWRAVIYSDASKFEVFRVDTRRRVWRMPGEALHPQKTAKKVAHGGGSVMVWGCITKSGVVRLHRISERLTSAGYAKILSEDLLGTLSDHRIHPHDIYFQRDGDKKQWTKLVMTLLEDHGIDSLPWPASSPDMNIIENLWAYLDEKVHNNKKPPKNTEELWESLRRKWLKIDQKYIDNLYESIPTRIQRLVEVKGGNTKY
jgi:hypothetical protein